MGNPKTIAIEETLEVELKLINRYPGAAGQSMARMGIGKLGFNGSVFKPRAGTASKIDLELNDTSSCVVGETISEKTPCSVIFDCDDYTKLGRKAKPLRFELPSRTIPSPVVIEIA